MPAGGEAKGLHWDEFEESRNPPLLGGVGEGQEFASTVRYPLRGRIGEVPFSVREHIPPSVILRDAVPFSVEGEEPPDSEGQSANG